MTAGNKKGSDETAGAALVGTEEFRGWLGSVNYRWTSAQIKTLVTTQKRAMVKKAADQSAANYTASSLIAFDSEVYDVGNWHDNVTNNSRLTVPSGVTVVQVGAVVRIDLTTADTWKNIELLKNGTVVFDGYIAQKVEVGAADLAISFCSGPIVVVAGDYFEVNLQEESDTSITITASRTNFWIRQLE